MIDALEQSELAPTMLSIEVTETAAADAKALLNGALNLKSLGCSLSLDDFGVCRSTLQQGHSLPINTLKIDRTFVRRIHTNETSNKIVRSILAMCRDLAIDCVVEGVETTEELECVRPGGKGARRSWPSSRTTWR